MICGWFGDGLCHMLDSDLLLKILSGGIPPDELWKFVKSVMDDPNTPTEVQEQLQQALDVVSRKKR
jgi:hypothetical protein